MSVQLDILKFVDVNFFKISDVYMDKAFLETR